MAQASRDQNSVPTLLAVSSADGTTPTTLYANPTTHRLLVDSAGSGGGVASINGDTSAAQTLAVGTSGTDFAIVDDMAGTHTFNLPSASATARGVITTGTQTIAGAKTFSGAISASNLSGTNTGDQTLNSLLPSQGGNNGKFLTTNGSNTSWASVSGSGTVTGVLVASSNGFTGTSDGDSATPTLTLATSITGVLKGNGTAISAATVGTDYVTASSTNTFTNKTYDTAGTGNSFSINGVAATANTGTGSVVRATSPTLTTPTLGVATATSINKMAITAPATSSTLAVADGKTLTASNTLTFTGTDSSSVAFGTGGTVAYTNVVTLSSLALPESQVTFTDITTGNVSTTKHGFAPKAPNDATKYLDGSGAYSVPTGSGTTVTTLLPQPNFQTKYSTGTALTLSVNTSASVGQIVIPFTIVVNTVTFLSGTNTTPGVIKIGLYTADGQTQKFNKTSGTISATGLQTLTLASPTTITPGCYYFVVMSVGSTNLAINSFETANTSTSIKSIGSGAIMDGTLTVTADTLPTTFSPSADISAANNNTATIRLE